MADIRKEDIQKQVTERALTVKQLDEDAKAIRASIARENAELEEIARIRDKEVHAIKALEMFLPESERWTQWRRTDKKDGDPLALSTRMAEVLEKNRDGLNARTVLAEVRKLGYQTTAENPLAMVQGTLHRRKDLFCQLKNKTWILKKYAPAPNENVLQFKAQS